MKLKTYIINLKESTERRASILQATSNYPFLDVELIEAVDGKQMREEEVSRLFDVKKFIRTYGRFPARGEIGCTLSHRTCYERLLSSNEPYALILEDDACFVCPEDTEYVLRQGVKLLEGKNATIVLFVCKVLHYNRPRRINHKYSVYPVCNAYCTYAYLVDRESVERLLNDRHPGMVADDFKLIRQMGIRVASIYPSIIYPGDMGSLIDDERTKMQATKYSFMRRLKVFSKNKLRILATSLGWLINRDFL